MMGEETVECITREVKKKIANVPTIHFYPMIKIAGCIRCSSSALDTFSLCICSAWLLFEELAFDRDCVDCTNSCKVDVSHSS